MDRFKKEFPHTFTAGLGNPQKVDDELDIINMSIKIRETADWDVKLNDPKVVAKWKSEISDEIKNSEAKFQFVLKELEYYLSLRDGPVEVAAVDGTWQSDSLIDDTLREKLISGARDLEDVPEKYKDWHPRTNEQVLNLVNPSMYCFVQGKSKAFRRPLEFKGCSDQESHVFQLLSSPSITKYLGPKAATKRFDGHTQIFNKRTKSKNHQWLPCEMQWNENGSIEIASYINNLHPDNHKELYASIQKIFEKFIPLFNKVLTDLRNPRPHKRLGNAGIIYKKPEKNFQFQDDDVICISSSDDDDDDDDDDEKNRKLKPIAIPEFSEPEKPRLTVNLKGRPLQVIVTLVNIELTPEKPTYFGGEWHLEGMANERIVASGIYYYSNENIAESRLHFRQAVSEPEYEPGHKTSVYEFQSTTPLNQELGSIVAKEGRCIAFPNTLQHRVGSFGLEDPSKPGHRKILVFFLVDPTLQVISTASVPPQQKSWYINEVTRELTALFPEELASKIANMVHTENLMTLDEAKQVRDELMNERKFFIKYNNRDPADDFQRQFAFRRLQPVGNRKRHGPIELRCN